MGIFVSVLDQMLFLFLCALIGFLLHKFNILPENADLTISRLENYIFMPALILNSFTTYCTVDNLLQNTNSLLYSCLFLAISTAIAIFLSPKFSDDPMEQGIYRYSFAVTNFGFMGNSMVQGLFGDEALFRYLVFTIPTNILVFSAGMIWLTSGKKKFSFKMLLNPTFIFLVIGIILGITKCPIPSFVQKTFDACADCFSPLAMVLTGFVIARYKFSMLFRQIKVYWVTFIRVIAMPLLFLGLCVLLNIPQDVRLLMLFSSAMPLGLNTIVFPAAYGKDTTLGAGMAVISNLIGLITVPLIFSLIL